MKKLFFCGLIVLSGCSSIQSIPVSDYTGKPLPGFPYHLTATNLEIKINRQLENCNGGKLQFKTVFEIKPSEVRDSTHSYIIDPSKLQSWIKSTVLKMEYHPNGSLKSINSEAEDMTGELITAVVGTTAKVVAGLAAAGDGIDVSAGSICTPEVNAALLKLKESEATLKDSNAALSIATNELNSLTERRKVAGKFWTIEQSNELLSSVEKMQSVKVSHETLSKTIEDEFKKFTLTHTINLSYKNTANWFSEPIDHVTVEEIEKKKKWLISNWQKTTEPELCNAGPGGAEAKCFAGLSLMIVNSGADSKTILQHINGVTATNPTDGFVFRIPQTATLNFIKVKKKEGKYQPDGDIDSASVAISQLGSLHLIPFKSYPFSKLKFSAEFSESGSLTKIGSESTSGVSKATTALDSVVTKTGEIRKTKAEESLNDMKAQAALLKAQKELIDAKKLLEPKTDDENKVATLKASTALYEAELANLKAEKALKDATSVGDAE